MLLAGGASRRFGGRPKGLARLGGERIADRALAALRGASTRCLIVANDPDAPGWFPGERVVPDDRTGLGPLGGIETALRAAAGDPVLVVAWDMPFVSVELLRALRRHGEAGAIAVVPVHGAEAWAEPLCAWYSSAVLATCRALLDAGERRAAALFGALSSAATIRDEELARFGDPARMFSSVDSVEDLSALGGSLDHGNG